MKYPYLVAVLASPVIAYATPPFSVASFEVGDVFLTMDKGPCEGNANLAFGVKKNGDKDTGCWVPNGPYIQVVWLDGAVDRIPTHAFKTPEKI